MFPPGAAPATDTPSPVPQSRQTVPRSSSEKKIVSNEWAGRLRPSPPFDGQSIRVFGLGFLQPLAGYPPAELPSFEPEHSSPEPHHYPLQFRAAGAAFP